ncbi:hypothetical protein KBB96_12055 [Luteolibacter ambystomatis]|uniref:Lipoprotein n=1 Tax=Luteolibacter ambystomatis TaxID=2824561 RepID=A0A975IZE3_9BACT|nr:hypothetical protein [Luteolibacter ambystomatis]QUE49605.1 hypothetical protein KBB96_12055 [Luteolibacter ambystomatis]
MKLFPWLAFVPVLALSACKDPVTFTRPSMEEVARYRALNVTDVSASNRGSLCAVSVYGGAAGLEGGATAPEMMLDSPQGAICTGYLRDVQPDRVVLSISFRNESGVMDRKEVVIPKRMIREFKVAP